MSNLDWDIDKLATLGRFFLKKVKNHMRNNENATVCFGETGKGIQPNYEIKFASGTVLTINGASHNKFSNTDKFNSDKISQIFTLADIDQAIKKAN